jgi:hypothetical protein
MRHKFPHLLKNDVTSVHFVTGYVRDILGDTCYSVGEPRPTGINLYHGRRQEGAASFPKGGTATIFAYKLMFKPFEDIFSVLSLFKKRE